MNDNIVVEVVYVYIQLKKRKKKEGFFFNGNNY